jgi:hypothetical protein
MMPYEMVQLKSFNQESLVQESFIRSDIRSELSVQNHPAFISP